MQSALNHSPDLTMVEIIPKLFDHNFLSDVEFLVEGKAIHAHSFILMMRSVVFHNQLRVVAGEQKRIPIDNVTYKSAYQFIRFIYTDQCDVTGENALDLFKMARQYKVIKLENLVIGSVSDGCDVYLNFYEHFLLENEHFQMRRFEIVVLEKLGKCLNSNRFLTLHPTAIETILSFDRTTVSEFRLLEALTRWIAHNSKQEQIGDKQQRTHYQYLIRLIRFSALTPDEFSKCLTNHAHLITASDFNIPTSSILRATYEFDNDWLKFSQNEKFKTKFSVTRDLVLAGVRFGNQKNRAGANFRFSQRNCLSNKIEYFTMACGASPKWNIDVINLGESIRLQPNMKYTLEILYCSTAEEITIFCRREKTKFISNKLNVVRLEKVSRNLFELFFKIAE